VLTLDTGHSSVCSVYGFLQTPLAILVEMSLFAEVFASMSLVELVELSLAGESDVERHETCDDVLDLERACVVVDSFKRCTKSSCVVLEGV
jgi:hypothetical protein